MYPTRDDVGKHRYDVVLVGAMLGSPLGSVLVTVSETAGGG